MQTLEQIAAGLPTDKGSIHSYLPFYDRLLAPIRDSALRVTEIGVDGGGSILMWLRYFRITNITAIDINPCPELISNNKRITHWQGNAYSQEAIDRLGKNYPRDVIIEDGDRNMVFLTEAQADDLASQLWNRNLKQEKAA